MDNRFCVGARFAPDSTLIISGALAAFLVFIGLVAGASWTGHALYWCVLGGLFALFIGRLAYIQFNRRWIIPTHDGLILEDRGGQVSVADGQVLDLTFSTRIRYVSGKPRANENRGQLLFGAEGSARRFAFRHDAPLGGSDALEGTFDRILTGLTDRARANLPSQPWTGNGWEYDPSGLTFGSGRNRRTVALDEIAAVDLLEGDVCVWAAGESMPCLRVPARSTGALVLGRLLTWDLSKRPKADDESTEGLGRVLFERGKSGVRLGKAALAILIGMWLTALGSWALGYSMLAAVAVILGIVTAPLFLIVWISESKYFRCCVRGVYQRTVWGTTELRYEDVGSFTYCAIRNYYNGIYSGTTIEMRFRPQSRTAGRDIQVNTRLDGGDEELENLRDHIAQVIASRLHRRLSNGKDVDWTSGLSFLPEGLELTTPGGLFRRAETRLIPYHRVAGTDLQDGHFYLFEHGKPKSIYMTPVSVENFFPGFVLLQRLLYDPSARPVLAQAQGT